MKKKVKKYLLSKNKHEYTNLDKLFEMYLNDEIKCILYNYEGVSIYPNICKIKGKLEKTIQVCFNCHNIYAIIDFFEDKYNVVIYPSGISVEKFESLFVDYEYPDDFTLQKLIKDIDRQIKNHSKLRDTTLIKKKTKKYLIISWICLSLPILICGGIGLYCAITKNVVKGNIWWGIFFIIIPLITSFIFDLKAKKIKNKT